MPLALRLDVLAGPAQNKSYTTDPGVTQASLACMTVHLFSVYRQRAAATAVMQHMLECCPHTLRAACL